jgi:hypothetical protein
VIPKKAIVAGIFSAIIGVGMLAMPVKAMARDWDHDGDSGRHEHHDNGRHNGWSNYGGGNGWTNQRGDNDGDERSYRGRGYYQQPGYGYRHEPDADDYGYGNGYGNSYGYGGRNNGWNGNGMVSRRHPGLVWSCDSQGHHCQWAQRGGYGYPQTGLNPFDGNNGYGNGYGNNSYGNGYYGNSAYGNNGYYGNNAPMGGLGSLLGILP